MAVHLMTGPYSGQTVCGHAVDVGHSATLHPIGVTCTDCIYIELAEAEAAEVEMMEAEANRMAEGYGMLRTWE